MSLKNSIKQQVKQDYYTKLLSKNNYLECFFDDKFNDINTNIKFKMLNKIIYPQIQFVNENEYKNNIISFILEHMDFFNFEAIDSFNRPYYLHTNWLNIIKQIEKSSIEEVKDEFNTVIQPSVIFHLTKIIHYISKNTLKYLIHKQKYFKKLKVEELNNILINSIIGINVSFFCYQTKINEGYRDIRIRYKCFIRLFNRINGELIEKEVNEMVYENKKRIVEETLNGVVCKDVVDYVIMKYID